jgi:hypothetical protein
MVSVGCLLLAIPFQKLNQPVLRVFVNSDCPIARRYTPELNRIYREFGSRVSMRLVYCDPDFSRGAAEKHHREFKLAMSFEQDSRQTLAKSLGVVTVPTAVLSEAGTDGKNGKVLYFGRIDNAYGADYKWRKPTDFDLRNAMDDVLKGRKVRLAKTVAIGCSLPRS